MVQTLVDCMDLCKRALIVFKWRLIHWKWQANVWSGTWSNMPPAIRRSGIRTTRCAGCSVVGPGDTTAFFMATFSRS